MPSSRASSSTAAFKGEGADRGAGCAVRGDLRPVADDVIADGERVREVIDRHAADAALLHRRAGERARLEFEDGLGGDDATVSLRAKLNFDDGAGGGPSGAEDVLTAHLDLDRAAGFLRQHVGERFEVDDRLAAEAAADLGRDGSDVGDVGAADARR